MSHPSPWLQVCDLVSSKGQLALAPAMVGEGHWGAPGPHPGTHADPRDTFPAQPMGRPRSGVLPGLEDTGDPGGAGASPPPGPLPGGRLEVKVRPPGHRAWARAPPWGQIRKSAPQLQTPRSPWPGAELGGRVSPPAGQGGMHAGLWGQALARSPLMRGWQWRVGGQPGGLGLLAFLTVYQPVLCSWQTFKILLSLKKI